MLSKVSFGGTVSKVESAFVYWWVQVFLDHLRFTEAVHHSSIRCKEITNRYFTRNTQT